VIKGKKSFLSTEEIQDDASNTATLVAAIDEYNAIYNYKNSDDEIVDIDPYSASGSELVPTTYYERYVEENDALKDIIVIKPDSIGAIFEQFQDQMRL
jgi:hypothetical protein